MFTLYDLEEFKEVIIDAPLQFRYAISNYGRMISFTNDFNDGRLLKGSTIDGYKIFRYKVREGDKVKNKHIFYYRMVAENFIPKTSDDQVFILHLDRNRANDFVRNLKWATKKEMLEHQRSSPYVIEAKKKLIEHNIKADGQKLTATKVMIIKKWLANPNRNAKVKTLAKRFGVSEMQIYRIKSGENWGHIKV